VGKDADQVYKRKAFNYKEVWNYLVADEEIISDLSHYLCNLDNRYSEYVAICSRIKRNSSGSNRGRYGWDYNLVLLKRINNLKEVLTLQSGGTKFKQDCKRNEVEITSRMR
jgi:hypothetical protein